MKKLNLYELISLSKIEIEAKEKVDSFFQSFVDKNKQNKVEVLPSISKKQLEDAFLMLIKGDVRNEDIKSFKGVTSIDGLEISISDNPNQPTFGKGGRK